MSRAQTSFKQTLRSTKTEVDEAVREYFKTVSVSMYSRHGREAWAHVQDFSERPGKRIRGSLVLTAYEMFGGTDRREALKAAVAIELAQSYLLIIDDVMDRSDMRRGKPTIQRLYYERLAPIAGESKTHIGDMLAINAGLVASHAASLLMNDIAVSPERAVRLNKTFHANILATGFGQIDDLFSGIDRTTEEDILLTHELKTGYYTFINPMQIGAILAGATDEDCEKIAKFGVPAGIAFQLQDDIIGLFGESDETGKSYLDDLKEGKHTLIIQQALERADKQGAVTIVEALGNQTINKKQAQEVRTIITECGAREYADSMARRFAKQAQTEIAESEWPQQQQAFLHELMNFVVERLK